MNNEILNRPFPPRIVSRALALTLSLALTLAFCLIPHGAAWADSDTDMVPLVAEGFNARAAASVTPRIVGGTRADTGAWPWMAALVYTGMDSGSGQFCGGTLIDSDWIVTAAHCTEGLGPEDLEVVLGIQNLVTDPGLRLSADRIIVHENYNPVTLDSDIALIHLTETTDIVPLALVDAGDPKQLTTPLTPATIIGWGATDPMGTEYPEALRQATVPITPPLNALRVYGAQSFTINMLAAGFPAGGVDACYGDSGGPLVVFDYSLGNWVLAGITSWGNGCAMPRSPGVYTRVSRFSTWIRAMIYLFITWEPAFAGHPR